MHGGATRNHHKPIPWIAPGALVWIGVAIVSMIALAGLLLASHPGIDLLSNTSGSGQSVGASAGAGLPSFDKSVLQAHLSKLENLNISAVCSDYAINAVVTWNGPSEGQGGVYVGSRAIHNMFGNMTLLASNMTFAIESFTPNPSSTRGTESANATLLLLADTSAQGDVMATIFAHYQFVNANGAWKISQETWVYRLSIPILLGGEKVFQ